MTEKKFINNRAIHLGGGADIAFLLVVLAAYFAMFSSLTAVTVSQLVTLNLLGIAYLMMGIYGFKYILDTDNRLMHFAYFFLQLVLSGLIIFIGSGPASNVSMNSLLLLPLVVQSVVLLPQVVMLICNVFILAVFSVSNVKNSGNLTELMNTLPLFFIGQIFIVFFTQMAVTEQKSREEINRLVVELEDANKHLKEYALQVEELAVTQERNRLAREIHDGLGHYLTSIYMQIQASLAMLDIDREKAQDLLTKAQNLSQEALRDVRNSVSTLRSPLLEDIALSAASQRLIGQSQFNNMAVKFELLGTERHLTPQTNWTLFRALQEGINNSVKYSQAKNLEITLDFSDPNYVLLVVEDDGNGASNLKGGFGIIGIQERLKLLDGHCSVQTEEGKGFRIEIGIPG